MAYLKWNQKTITDFSDQNINSLYNEGYVFTRVDKGVMDQTRSLRIDLSKFELSSENRRILRKTENVHLEKLSLPYPTYHWSIGKLGKDFYDTKFGEGTFSANKIKELMTNGEKSNFNCVFVYTANEPHPSPLPLLGRENEMVPPPPTRGRTEEGVSIGYCIALETDEVVHYCYPFYLLQTTNYQLPPNLGLGMMLKAIVWSKENGKKYMYLGSFQRPRDTYKLQFAGLEWWDGEKWKNNLEQLKQSLK